MTPQEITRANVRRTWLLMTIFLGIIIAIGWSLSYLYNDVSILYIAVATAFFGNFFSYFFSHKIALSTAGAKQADERKDREIIHMVENMARQAGMDHAPKTYIISDPSMNAFATGRNDKNSVVALTTGLIKGLDKKELEGVIAHEITHIQNKDILVMTIVVVLLGTISIIADMFMRGAFRGKGGSDRGGNAHVVVLIIGIVFAILSPIVAKAIQMAISRKREFMADAGGANITMEPTALASALEKISGQGIPVKRAGTATAHLYISSPFGDGKKTKVDFLERIFSTHPPVAERISALRGMSNRGM
jgi:heat shock protein HtpX